MSFITMHKQGRSQHLLSTLLTGDQLYLKSSALLKEEADKFLKSFDDWREGAKGKKLYKPAIYARVEINFDYKRANIHVSKEFHLAAPFMDFYPFVDWSRSSFQISKADLQATPEEDALHDRLPSALSKMNDFTELEKELKEHLYRDYFLVIYYNPGLQIYSGLKESLEEFQLKCEGIIDEKIQDAIENLRNVYQRRFDQIEKRFMSEKDVLISDEMEYTARKREVLLTAGEPVLAFLQGRRSVDEIVQSGKDHDNLNKVKNRPDKLDPFDELRQQLYDLNFELEQEVVAIEERFKEYLKLTESIQIKPEKLDITVHSMGILWVLV
ncbi:MAG TPA: hypothetical protein VNM22_17205 [Candidatus Limnocylindrales bacterium]|nr:hypothetical protein [Candidatus Limnocylindrales bacterium]